MRNIEHQLVIIMPINLIYLVVSAMRKSMETTTDDDTDMAAYIQGLTASEISDETSIKVSPPMSTASNTLIQLLSYKRTTMRRATQYKRF